MFHRRSSFTGRWSSSLSWVSVGLGSATGIAGLFTASQEPSASLGLATGLLGVATGTLNTIRERILPSDLERDLWSMRNTASSLRDRFGDLYVEAGDPLRDLDLLSEDLDQLAEELRATEANPQANQVGEQDLFHAEEEFRTSRRFFNASVSLVGFSPVLLDDTLATEG